MHTANLEDNFSQFFVSRLGIIPKPTSFAAFVHDITAIISHTKATMQALNNRPMPTPLKKLTGSVVFIMVNFP